MAVSTRSREAVIDTDEDLSEDRENLASLLLNQEPEVQAIMVIEDGEWVERMLPASSAPAIEIESNLKDTELLPSWFEGRGKTMEAKWLNLDTRYSMRQMQKGWRPVRPAHYQDARYTVKKHVDLGEIIIYMDVFLAEMPRERAEKLRKMKNDQMLHDRIARIYGLNVDPDALKDATGGLAKIIQEAGQIGLESSSLSQLPYDSPMAREARALADRLYAEKEKSIRLNARR